MLGFAPARGAETMSQENPRRLESLEINEADDGLVVYDPATGMVHHLNPSAAIVFDLCDGARDAAEIARILGEAFELSSPPSDEATAALRDLAERGLVEWGAQED